MGQYYKTAKPTFVDDVIYQAPHELMLGALKTQDADLDKQNKELDSFDTMGDLLGFVDKDREARNERLDLHRGKAQELAEKIQQNPAMYQHYIKDINRAKREFEKDIKSGDLFEMDRTDKRRTALRDKISKNKKISEQARAQALAKIDRDYKGNGKGDFAEDLHIYDKIDEVGFQKDLKALINVDTEGTTTTVPKNGYLISDGETKTYLTDERLKAIIDSDPAMENWKREQLQTLSRSLENGEFEDETDMHAEYNKRLQDFKQNTIEKLGFKKITSTHGIKTDGAYWQKKRLGLDWTKFNHQKKKDEANLNSYEVVMNGNYETVSGDKINEIYGGKKRVPGPANQGQNPPTGELSTAEKRKRLDAEKKSLEGKLSKLGISLEDFRNKMMTHKGRIELAEGTGMSKEKLARQANYNKSYSYSTVKSPLDQGKSAIENAKYQKTVVNSFNNLTPSDVVTTKIIDSKGNIRSEKNISLGEAFEKGYVQGQTSAQTVKELIPHPAGGFKGLDGNFITMPDPNGGEEEVVATKEYALSSGKAQSKLVKTQGFDATKPLLHIKGSQISESKKRNFGNGKTKATEKQMYNIHTSKMINGELMTVIISKDLKIKPIQ